MDGTILQQRNNADETVLMRLNASATEFEVTLVHGKGKPECLYDEERHRYRGSSAYYIEVNTIDLDNSKEIDYRVVVLDDSVRFRILGINIAIRKVYEYTPFVLLIFSYPHVLVPRL